jgi:(2Fe-2S) ferredoxin
MREQKQLPALHVFVCANRRDPSSPLGAGCGRYGERVYDALKDRVAARGAHGSTWITKTHCLGICPRTGCTIALYPDQAILSEVTADEAVQVLEARWNR